MNSDDKSKPTMTEKNKVILLIVIVLSLITFVGMFTYKVAAHVREQEKEGVWQNNHRYIKIKYSNWVHDPDCPCGGIEGNIRSVK